ncbi:unnamed protein product [Protopolystoma xenopodis]|uniref:Uncharacterized protein n=1 Tax=Protopolystoma xenopodis TaxID=117903 RepID=A0A3S5FFQ8_9PLAT|nr:unnamed protein product [Protopolystoma xenopodis]
MFRTLPQAFHSTYTPASLSKHSKYEFSDGMQNEHCRLPYVADNIYDQACLLSADYRWSPPHLLRFSIVGITSISSGSVG